MTDAEPRVFDELAVLRSIVEGTATETGDRFFSALVENLATAMGTMGAWVAVFEDGERTLRAVAMKIRDRRLDGFCYSIEGTPCETAIKERRLVHIPHRIVALYRDDPSLMPYGAVSYMGVPLIDAGGRVMGQLAVLGDEPMPPDPRATAIFTIFASRASAELRRLAAERATREREAQMSLLLGTAMDAIVNLDAELRVVLMNPAARRIFGYEDATPHGLDFTTLLATEAREHLRKYVLPPSNGDQTSCSWIPGGLQAVARNGRRFRADATVSLYEAEGRLRVTLILRDAEDRIRAENQIRSLENEAELLREQLRSLENFEPILGSSPALIRALHEVEKVAPTDTTVLLLGETGTGKELFARALHAGSARRDKALVSVNCGAIPGNLVESELFGHEKGAFTGATHRRAGRFALADGGTLFLDEIGELPVELQPKLLRVLQEGEFEPVGGARTLKVDVRVVAATNRNLAQRVNEGSFREDLYYRLNVFPITIPPLRERGSDVAELARAFLDKFSRRMGRSLAPLSAACEARLLGYSWPGNVRELANVIERGVIISSGSEFDIDRALPADSVSRIDRPPPAEGEAKVLSAPELVTLERANIVRALNAVGWKVAGEKGAAALLEMNPSTLSSRMRALGIRRPPRP